jgi:myo-inositol-1(or 4)-monophosphatase
MEAKIKGIEKVLYRCGELLRNAERDSISVNSKDGIGNFVTSYDKQVQEILREELLRIIPEATFVGEEEDVHASIENGIAFTVDPIDGTYNFMRDLKTSCISVGITKDGAPLAGLVYNPYADEMYTAIVGNGAYMNGRRIHVSDGELGGGLVLFGTSPYHRELRKKTMQYADEILDYAADVRRMGSAALDLCAIAAGKAELYFELQLQPWDYMAGLVIVTEAGGKVTTMIKEAIKLGTPCSVLATNGKADYDFGRFYPKKESGKRL